MPASRFLSSVVVCALFTLGLVPIATATADDATTTPAPVQILPLTTSTGEVTEAGEAGLDGTAASAPQETSPAAEDDAASEGSEGEGAEKADPAAESDTDSDSQGEAAEETSPAAEAEPASADSSADPLADAVVLTDPLVVDDFLVAGFRWSGTDTLPEGLSIYLRVREDGSWTPWYEGADSGAGKDTGGVAGTEEFITGGADAVQVSIVGDRADLPADLALAMVPADPSGEETLEVSDLETTQAEPTQVATPDAAHEETAPDPAQEASPGPTAQEASFTTPLTTTAPAALPAVETAAATAGVQAANVDAEVGQAVQPAIVAATTTAGSLPVPVHTRAEWGANPSYMTWSPEYVSAGHVVVHHTAGTNNYTAGQSASIVRGIYYYHAVTLDWGDIGYNFLVDKYGQVFEGRSGTLSAAPGTMVIGAHARGVNTGSMGISMMGDYSSVSPTSVTLDRVGKLAGWFLGRGGYMNVNEVAGILVRTTEKYQAGTVLQLPRIFGHRDSGATSCPGNVGYSLLGTIRSIAQKQAQISGRSATAVGWVNGGGSWFHYASPGVLTLGWLKDGSRWYYLDPGSGAMATGWAYINSKWYYFDRGSGAMATGWIYVGSSWYYLNPGNGAMATGWLKLGSSWYYLTPQTGAMARGWAYINSKWYYFDRGSGAMATGWIYVGSSWYYLNPGNGAMATGWLKLGSSWYYLVPQTGAMATGWVYINSKWYHLNPRTGVLDN